MKALQMTAHRTEAGLVDLAEPVPGPGEVAVDVTSAALNPLDLKIAAGAVRDWFPVTFPFTLGTDIAGVVGAVGPGVTGWGPGDRVVARLDPSAGGAFAEAAVVGADHLVRAPATIPLEAAAGLPTAAATAWQALTEVAGVRPGQTVLVHAAAGGVGGFAVQLARRLGARVVATASGPGLAIAGELGADSVIDHRKARFEDAVSGVDVVLDTVGGDVGVRSLDVLRPGGLLVAVAMPPDPAAAERRGVRAEFVFHSSDARRLAQVVEQVNAGVRVLVDRVLPLAEGRRALAYLADGHAKGKVLLTMG